MNSDDFKPALWFVLVLPVLARLSVECLFYGTDSVPTAPESLGTAVCTMIIANLMWPVFWTDGKPYLRHLGSWSLTTAVVAALLIMADVPVGAWLSLALPLAAGVMIICALLGTLTLLTIRLFRIPAYIAHRTVLVFLILTCTAPLWLSPAAEILASQTFTDLVIAISPVGYLTSLIEYDLLRSAWFYTHTPLSGLRYDYPDPTIFTAVYCSLATLMLSLASARWRNWLAAKGNSRITSFYSIYKDSIS